MNKTKRKPQAEHEKAQIEAINIEIQKVAENPPSSFRDKAYALFNLFAQFPLSEQRRRRRLDDDHLFLEDNIPWLTNGSMCRSMGRLFRLETKHGLDGTIYFASIEAGLAHSRCMSILDEISEHLKEHPEDDFQALSRAYLEQALRERGIEADLNPSATTAATPAEAPRAIAAPMPPVENRLTSSWVNGLEAFADQLNISTADYMHRYVTATVLIEQQAAATFVRANATPAPKQSSTTTSSNATPAAPRVQRRKSEPRKRDRRTKEEIAAMVTVMHELMGADVLEGIKVAQKLQDYDDEHQTKYYPRNRNARAYICYILRTHPKVFVNVKKGVYKAKDPFVPRQKDGDGRVIQLTRRG